MRPYTLDEALALPYGITTDDAAYMDFYGPSMEQAYIQAEIAFRFSSYYVAQMFVKSVYVGMAAIVVAATFRRISRHYLVGGALTTASSMIDKHVMLAPTFGANSNELFYAVPRRFAGRWVTIQIPTVFHSTAIAVFNVANTIILFTPYMNVTPNIYWPDLGWAFGAYLRYFSDRTGIIAIGLTPLVVALASRNSLIGTVSGASFSTLQIYHRWVARWTYIHAFLHSWGYTIQFLWQGEAYYKEQLRDPYIVWGCVATAAGSVLAVLSWRRLREIAYEIFVVGHVIAAVFWVVGTYYHVFLLESYETVKWVYAAIAIWAFDRFIRGARLAWLNSPRLSSLIHKAGSRKRSLFEAHAQVISAGEFVRIRVTPARGWPSVAAGPGTYVFVSRPWHWASWGNHPLTIAWPAGMPPVPSVGSNNDEKDSQDPGEAGDLDIQLARPGDKASFELVMKRWDGFTKRLTKGLRSFGDHEAGNLSGGISRLSLCVEGPYGHAESFAHLDAALLVAGGSGITAMLAHLADLAKAEVDNRLALHEIRLLWAIRDYHTREAILPYLRVLSSYFASRPAGFLQIDLHITGSVAQAKCEEEQQEEKASRSSGTDSAEKTADDGGLQTPSYSMNELAPVAHTLHVPAAFPCTVHHGRPSVSAYMDAMGQVKEGKLKRIGVAVCGPPGFCDAAKQAVRERIGAKGQPNAWVFSEELFSW